MGTETLPDRSDGQTIDETWFDIIRDAMKGNFVPRNTSGVATDAAGSMGTSTYRWSDVHADQATIPGAISAGSITFTTTPYTPPGVIVPYAASDEPTGFLKCNGQAVSRTIYAALYAAIGDAYGEGDGSITFHVPDFRGRFLRGQDEGTGRDPNAGDRSAMATGGNTGDAIGSLQGDSTKMPAAQFETANETAHQHQIGARTNGTVGTDTKLLRSDGIAGISSPVDSDTSSHNHTITGGDDETRPINAYVRYLIKT